jgi:uncharacterized protein YhaN
LLSTHDQYEELCALAVSGQASRAQLTDLQSHLEDCAACRDTAYDFTQISAQGLSQLAAKRLRCEIPSGMTQRFVARARSEGIEISRENVPPIRKPQRARIYASVCAAAAVAVVAAFLLIARQKSSPAAANPHQDAGSPASVANGGPSSLSRQNQNTQLTQELASARSEITSLGAKVQKQRSDLESASEAQTLLTSRLDAAQQENMNVRSEKAQSEARIAGLEADMAKSKSDKSTSDTALALRETELRELRSKLADQEAVLNQQEELAARGSDVRDLVVARNLHIIDVHDRDGNGKSQRASGRIFYTEGKSLIFYAYDLADPRRVDAKVSFYVWGERLGAENPIRSLGIFHNDDRNDGRWVLTFDDPRVLAQINSVFVTVESSKKAIKEPGGKRILFAFLGDKPNHP